MAKYPWSRCIADQLRSNKWVRKGGSRKARRQRAARVCGSIKARSNR